MSVAFAPPFLSGSIALPFPEDPGSPPPDISSASRSGAEFQPEFTLSGLQSPPVHQIAQHLAQHSLSPGCASGIVGFMAINQKTLWLSYAACVVAMVAGLAFLISLRHFIAGVVLGAIGLAGMGILAWEIQRS